MMRPHRFASMYGSARRVAQNVLLRFHARAFVPGLVGQLVDAGEAVRAAGVVDQDVDAAEVIGDAVDQRLRLGLVADVAGDEARAIGTAHLVQRLLAFVGRSAADHDLGPLGEERVGDGPADAPRPSGDHGHPVLQQ